MTHYLRSRHDAILVGIGTVKADNPGLSTRYSEDGKEVVGLHRQPRPLILDPSARWQVEDTPKLFSLAEKGEGRAPWWIVGPGNRVENGKLKQKLMEVGGGVCSAGSSAVRKDGFDWERILMALAEWGMRSVMIEGGGTVRCLSFYLSLCVSCGIYEANIMNRLSRTCCRRRIINSSAA